MNTEMLVTGQPRAASQADASEQLTMALQPLNADRLPSDAARCAMEVQQQAVSSASARSDIQQQPSQTVTGRLEPQERDNSPLQGPAVGYPGVAVPKLGDAERHQRHPLHGQGKTPVVHGSAAAQLNSSSKQLYRSTQSRAGTLTCPGGPLDACLRQGAAHQSVDQGGGVALPPLPPDLVVSDR